MYMCCFAAQGWFKGSWSSWEALSSLRIGTELECFNSSKSESFLQSFAKLPVNVLVPCLLNRLESQQFLLEVGFYSRR